MTEVIEVTEGPVSIQVIQKVQQARKLGLEVIYIGDINKMDARLRALWDASTK